MVGFVIQDTSFGREVEWVGEASNLSRIKNPTERTVVLTLGSLDHPTSTLDSLPSH